MIFILLDSDQQPWYRVLPVKFKEERQMVESTLRHEMCGEMETKTCFEALCV
jgi:hypothetical protein